MLRKQETLFYNQYYFSIVRELGYVFLIAIGKYS
jgi:hypothetical protein